MRPLVIGLSHHSAPLDIIERANLDVAARDQLVERLRESGLADEVLVVSTCNRLEVYASVAAFHAAVNTISAELAAAAGQPVAQLTPHLYVHYDEQAISHLFTVACGLDSMAVGEGQILGQLRAALAIALDSNTVGAELNSLFQTALRVGKRAHSETRIDSVSGSLVDTALEIAAEQLGDLADRRFVVLGAGGMSSLVATTVAGIVTTPAGMPAGSLTLVSRTFVRAHSVAERLGGQAQSWAALGESLTNVDVVISCTGARGHVVTEAIARQSSARVWIDLALPRDIEPAVGDPTGRTLIDLEMVGARLGARGVSPEVEAVTALVEAEVRDFLAARSLRSVAPTVSALRSQAAGVVAAELSRLEARLPGLDDKTRAELQLAIHRVVEKLLHTPTVRIKQYASGPEGGDYARALAHLFDLDPAQVAAVTQPRIDASAATPDSSHTGALPTGREQATGADR